MTRVPRLPPDDSTPPGLAARLKAAPVLPKGESAAKRIAAFLDGVEDAAVREGLASLLKAPKARALVAGILVHSPFLAGIATHHPAHLLALLTEDPDACFARLKAEAVAACRKARSDEGVGRALRRFRAEVALLVALADIGDVWPLETVTRALTETADLAVAEAVVHLMSDFAEAGTLAPPDLKRPEAASGYIVLAMGKHGADRKSVV